MRSPLYLNALGLLCPLGNDRRQVLDGLLTGRRTGMVETDEYRPGRPCIVGRVDAGLPEIPPHLARYDCRNNRLLLAALAQIRSTLDAFIDRFGADRIGIVLGTSTSGVRNGEMALTQLHRLGRVPAQYHYKQQEIGGGAEFLARYLDLGGPAFTVSTACSSSAKALGSARRLIALGLCDAVIVGGADSLCRLTLQGFSALEAVSAGHCNPFSVNRDGINIGEAAALFILSAEPGPVTLLGIGASSDAYHISAPDPEGRGALGAMTAALNDAQLSPESIDYLNLHGTGTLQNDAMESLAVSELFDDGLPVSSTKGITGHTLGAAGALEAGFCWLLLDQPDADGRLAPNVYDGDTDPGLPALNLVRPGQALGRPLTVCQSNSFGFGGSNASVVLGRG
jgi:3-oxoacyl-[acyl-carrier-protein] synthase-1